MEDIYKFFEDNLNNVTARIHMGNVSIEGHMEGECLLKMENKFQGIYLYSELKWNEGIKPREVIRQACLDREEFSYAEFDKIMDKIPAFFESKWVRIGTIRPYAIKSILSKFSDKKLWAVEITYEDGSICKINNIKPFKNHEILINFISIL